jgi:hypothetical protein
MILGLRARFALPEPADTNTDTQLVILLDRLQHNTLLLPLPSAGHLPARPLLRLMSLEHDELISPAEESSGASMPASTSASALPLPPTSESQQEPHNFTEKEVGEYKESDRYLPVRRYLQILI